MGLFSRLVFGRQKVYSNQKKASHYVLTEDNVDILKENDKIEDMKFAGTPIEIGDENKVVAEDGSEYKI